MNLKDVDFILDSGYSNSAKVLLVKSLSLPDNWTWKKQWILNFLKIKEHQWRAISNELKDGGYLMYKHISTGKNGIKRELKISFSGFNVRDVDIQHDEKTDDLSINLHDVDFSCDDKPTHIYTNTNRVPKVLTAGNICVDLSCREKSTSRKTDYMPEGMKNLDQWVYWKYIKKGKYITKIPFYGKGKPAKTNDCKTWLSFDGVLNYKELGFDGIGFVLTEKDPFVVVDLDKCIEKNKINTFAQNAVNYFKSYTEISPSGNGLHIVVTGKIDKAIVKPGLEVYSKLRYICFTGDLVWDFDVAKRQREIDHMVYKYGKKEPEPIKENPKNFKDNGTYKLPKKIFAEGSRNNELARQCGVIKTKVKSENEYWFHVWEVNNKCCDPPLSQYEVTQTAGRLWRSQ